MAVSRDDVQDATGRRTFISGVGPVSGVGGGDMRGWPMNATDANATTGVPTNGRAGFLPGATYQNFKGAAGSVFYINVGTVASATWVELTGGGGMSFITIGANTGPNDFYFTDGTTKVLSFDTRNTVTGVKAVSVTASPPTIASATGDTFSQLYVSPVTVTLTGTTTVTALDGIGLYLDIPTVTDASAATVTTVSNLYVAAPAAAGGSATITNSFAAHFGGAIKVDGNINVSAQATTATIVAATAAAFVVSDGTTSMISANTVTTAGTAGSGGTTFTGQPMTLASAASAFNTATVHIAARTNTLTGTTTTTSWLGSALYLEQQTWTDASACTLTTASSMHIVANAAAGGSLTITNSYMISTSVAGAFLTNAGTWTSVSTAAHKQEIEDAETGDVFGILDQVKARSYKWKDRIEHQVENREDGTFHTEDIPMNDFGRMRYGLIAEELPEALKIPGTDNTQGLPDGIVAAFAVVACKKLREENTQLKQRLDRLEALFAKP